VALAVLVGVIFFMAIVKIDTPLKQAITAMPVTEKDKLLLRLVAKDKALVERLTFELLEGTNEDRERRANQIRDHIEESFTKYLNDSPGWLLVDFRNFSGTITAHVKATKDKEGEVFLNVYMLAKGIAQNLEMLRKMPRRADTLAPYLAKKLKTVLGKAEKLHEDYYIEFRADLNYVLEFMWSYEPTAIHAKLNNLPKKFDP
jgi:hypothetical protein